MASENNIIEQIEGQNKESGFDATAFISSDTAKEVQSIEESPVSEEVQVEAENTAEQAQTETTESNISGIYDFFKEVPELPKFIVGQISILCNYICS